MTPDERTLEAGPARVNGLPPRSEGCDTLVRELAFDLENEALRNHAVRLQARGLDADGLRYCLAVRGLDDLVRRHRGRRHHILIACAPKSASSFLSEALLEVTGFRRYFLAPLGEDRERQIERRSIPLFLATDTVSQEHLKATGPDVRLLREMHVRPVVLVRDLFDALVSLRDQIAHEPPAPWPMAHVPRGFAGWDEARQLWFVVRMFTPWYLSFFASWCDAMRTLDVLWITYDDVVACTRDTIRSVLHHVGLDFDDDAIDAGVARVNRARIRFNRGVRGRGRRMLSADQQRAVLEIAEPFRHEYDLAPLGVAAPAGSTLHTQETRA
jgi:hypothetical protein